MYRTGIAIMVIALLLALGLSCAHEAQAPATTGYYQLRQYAETSRQLVTIISATRTDSYDLVGWDLLFKMRKEASPGTDFILIEATAMNLSDASLSTSLADFTLKDSEGREYPYTDYKGAKSYPNTELAPGGVASGMVLFVVPETASGLEVSSLLDGSPPVLAIWKLE